MGVARGQCLRLSSNLAFKKNPDILELFCLQILDFVPCTKLNKELNLIIRTGALLFVSITFLEDVIGMGRANIYRMRFNSSELRGRFWFGSFCEKQVLCLFSRSSKAGMSGETKASLFAYFLQPNAEQNSHTGEWCDS